MVNLTLVVFGDLDVVEAMVAPPRALSPVADACGPIPYVALQSMIDRERAAATGRTIPIVRLRRS